MNQNMRKMRYIFIFEKL